MEKAPSGMADEKKKKSEDEVSGKAYDARLMRRLACYLGPYRTQATISVIAVILKAGSDAIGPYLLKVGLDRYLTSKSATGEGAGWLGRHLSSDPYQGLWQLTAIYLCALLLAYAFEFTQTYLMQWTGQKVMFDLRHQRDVHRRRPLHDR